MISWSKPLSPSLSARNCAPQWEREPRVAPAPINCDRLALCRTSASLLSCQSYASQRNFQPFGRLKVRAENTAVRCQPHLAARLEHPFDIALVAQHPHVLGDRPIDD